MGFWNRARGLARAGVTVPVCGSAVAADPWSSTRIGGGHLAKPERLFGLEGDLRIALDMTDVKLVDRNAVTFLAQCETRGIRLLHCPAYVREWIERARK